MFYLHRVRFHHTYDTRILKIARDVLADIKIPLSSDSAFPSLEAVLRQLNDPEAPALFKLLEQQAALEKRVQESENNAVNI